MDSAERVSRKRKSCEMESEPVISENREEVIAPNVKQQTQHDDETCDAIIKESEPKDDNIEVFKNESVSEDLSEGGAEDVNKDEPADKSMEVSDDTIGDVNEGKPEDVNIVQDADINKYEDVNKGTSGDEVNNHDLKEVINEEVKDVLNEEVKDILKEVITENVKYTNPEDIKESKVENVTSITEHNVEDISDKKVEDINDNKPGDTSENEIEKQNKENASTDKFVEENKSVNKENETTHDDLNETELTDEPAFTITFTGDNLKTYKPSFLNFIQAFPDLKIVDLNNVIQVFKNAPSEITSTNAKRNKRKKKKARKELFAGAELPAHAHDDDEGDGGNKRSKWELFVVDANPTSVNEIERDRVKFSSKFKVLDEDKDKQDRKDEEKKASGLGMCFNCNGNHAIKDCPEPKDFAKIRQAKMNFRNNSQKLTRYHVDEEKSHAHLKPGKISAKLREALGLGKYELPQHIYRMRVLGYPPGWLEEAKIVRSNITMFDMEGKNVREKASGNKSYIDPDKVVNYEGFNVKMERGVRDQCHLYGVPPFSKNHAKEAMINNMNMTMEDNLETCDMDIDASSDKEEETTIKSPRISPTLIDLELKKKQLLVELVDTECNDSTEMLMNKEVFTTLEEFSGDNSNENKSLADDSTQSKSLSPNSESNNSREKEGRDETKKTPDSNKQPNNGESDSDPGPLKLVKKSMAGTPILKSGSPYSRLPNPVNFMKDVSPVINFENLPNSTGKYEQMSSVLEKVRKTLKNIHEKT